MPKELGNTSLPDKVAAALVRRLHPNTGLHRKQLCAALNISRNTLDGWLAGKNPPTAENLLLLIDFFDAAFAAEVSGGKILKTPDRTIADKLAEIGRLTRELHNALGSPL
jgi:transcriptional regulator with XRE-family HTH domain